MRQEIVQIGMKTQRLVIAILAIFFPVFIHGQLFKTLGLGIESPKDLVADYYQPQMHIEGDILYVCTPQGLYSKDLSNDKSTWQLVGFEGIPLQDYARCGDDMLALRHRYYYDDHDAILLLSHNGGETYEDITPEPFNKKSDNHYSYAFLTLEQHPTDPKTLFTSFNMFQTSDFGKTWTKLTNMTPEYTGFHPLNPDIIYEAGGGEHTDDQNDFRISYNAGQTWQDKTECFPKYNAAYRVAFHPTDPNKWIVGGWGYVYTTNDNGQTWNSEYLGYSTFGNYDYICPWRYATYDNENADIIYMAGGSLDGSMRLMCSTDGGKTWNRPHLEPIKMAQYELVFDMKQYRDKLLIYSQSDVYEISKNELIEQTTSIQKITSAKENATIYDLQGRKMVNDVRKGITIQNGKKTLHR